MRASPLARLRALTRLAPEGGPAARVQAAWEWAIVLGLLLTIPAYYEVLLEPQRAWLALCLYALGGAAVLAGLAHTAWRTRAAPGHWRGNAFDVLLAACLVGAALLPPSAVSTPAWWWRSWTALLTLLRLTWALQPHLRRDGLTRLLAFALAVFGACRAGFWWLEPRALTFGDGLWLAFTTAATVGYGDIVPTTAASKVFSVFVVLLGYAVISLVTAAIAAMWVETQERRIEREILRDVHRQLESVHRELAALRREISAGDSS